MTGRSSPEASCRGQNFHRLVPGAGSPVGVPSTGLPATRPPVDRDVLAFAHSQTLTPRDFVIDAKGVCRLLSEMARRVAALDTGSAERTLQVTQAARLLECSLPKEVRDELLPDMWRARRYRTRFRLDRGAPHDAPQRIGGKRGRRSGAEWCLLLAVLLLLAVATGVVIGDIAGDERPGPEQRVTDSPSRFSLGFGLPVSSNVV